MTESELLAVAVEAAHAAADELMTRFGQQSEGVRAKSTPTDLVSDADVAAEAAIRRVLSERRPKDAILGEEGGASGEGAVRWIVDPLDGTINFLFGIPAFGVSVACQDEAGGLVGVVLDPVRNECFTATRSGSARLNGTDVVNPLREDLATALVATGFNYDAGLRARQAEVVGRLLPVVRDIRRVGSAALDLCWAACGRFDAFYERGIQPWDVAAGALVAERAGLTVRDLVEADGLPRGILVAPPALVDSLYGLVAT